MGELGIKFGFGPDRNAGSRALNVLYLSPHPTSDLAENDADG